MEKLKFIVIAFLLVHCSQSNDSDPISGSQIPGDAVVQDYVSTPGLQKATVKSGDITLAEGDFLDGLHQGTWTTYDPEDGKVTSITTYLKGKKQGVELTFDNLGYVTSKAYYHNDALSGEYLLYKRRVIVERKNYSNGLLNGLQQRFYNDGNLMEEKTYVDNTIDGQAKWYDQEGSLTIEYTYDMGQLVEE
ncbi:MAG: hypothetical protein GDA42_04550 [Ekhidna sp.]|nr:hypothetical protein [Ekhidna sp.]MBC6409716.1 hypothetical protein [Ekhidna sp.]